MNSHGTDVPADLNSTVEHFDECWHRGEVPAIDDFLRQDSLQTLDQARRHQLLVELVMIDLEYRWRRGLHKESAMGSCATPDVPAADKELPNRPRLEDYVRCYPQLGPTQALPVALVADEYRVRQRWGDEPDIDEYLQRFEPQADELSIILQRVKRRLPSTKSSGGVRVHCPHCDGTARLGETNLSDVICDSCGSHFTLFRDIEEADHSIDTKRLGRFHLLQRIGTGSFGTVWKAHDPGLDRIVAIKIPRCQQLDVTDVRMLLREARAAAQLKHPNIVGVHEVGREGDTAYIVGDYVEGSTLAGWMSDHRLDSRQSAELCAKISDALEYAHRAGVVHRDLKPGNIMIDASGEPQIMDFGLARREAGEVTVTLDGRVLGTPAYMSPEQASGEAHHADRRSDVYSLGVVLFELLTGEVPFRGNPRMLLQQVIHDDPPSLRKLNHAVARDLETVCLKCLEKRPGQRYQTARELSEDLRRFLRDDPVRARPTTRASRLWRWCKRNPTAAAAGGLVLFLAIVGPIVAANQTALHRAADAALEKAEDEARLASRNLAVSKLSEARALRWSGRPGRRFDALKALEEATQIFGSLGESDEHVLELRNEAIACLTLLDVREENTWPVEANNFGYFDASLQRFADSDLHGNIAIRRVSDQREIVRLKGRDVLAFGQDGRYAAVAEKNGRCQIWDLERPSALFDAPVPVHAEAVAFSPNGHTVAVGQQNGLIHLYEIPPAVEYKSLNAIPAPHPIRFHPEGGKLAVFSDVTTEGQIWDIGDGTIEERIALPSRTLDAAWHPAGRTLAVACADFNVYLFDSATGRRTAVLGGHEAEVVRVQFSHGGDTLASYSWDGTSRFWDAHTGRLLLTFDGKFRGFAPTDQQAAFRSVREDRHIAGIWQIAAGREVRTLYGHGGDKGPWGVDMHPEGRLMVSASADGVRLWDLAAVKQIAHLPIGDCKSAFFHADGQSLFTTGPYGLHQWRLARTSDGQSWRIGPPKRLSTSQASRRLFRASHSGNCESIALVAKDNEVGLLHLEGQQNRPRLVNSGAVSNLALSANGRWVATAHDEPDNSVKVWNTRTGALAAELPHSGGYLAVFFSPRDDSLVTSTRAYYQIWEVGRWQLRHTIERDSGLHGSVAFTRDASTMAAAYSRRVIKLYDTGIFQELATLGAPQPRELTWLCFSHDGSRLAAATSSHVIQVWDLRQIRDQLGQMCLDWKPSLTPRRPMLPNGSGAAPLSIEIDLGPLSASPKGH